MKRCILLFFLPFCFINCSVKQVNLEKDSLSFMGNYIIDTPLSLNFGLKDADDAQKHYCRIISPRYADMYAKMNVCSCILSTFFNTLFGVEEYVHRVTIYKFSNEKLDEIYFLNSLKGVKGNPTFFNIILKRLQILESK